MLPFRISEKDRHHRALRCPSFDREGFLEPAEQEPAGSSVICVVEPASRLKIVGRHLTGLPVLDQFVGDLLAVVQTAHSGAFYG